MYIFSTNLFKIYVLIEVEELLSRRIQKVQPISADNYGLGYKSQKAHWDVINTYSLLPDKRMLTICPDWLQCDSISLAFLMKLLWSKNRADCNYTIMDFEPGLWLSSCSFSSWYHICFIIMFHVLLKECVSCTWWGKSIKLS